MENEESPWRLAKYSSRCLLDGCHPTSSNRRRVQQLPTAAAIRCGLRIRGRIGQGKSYQSVVYLKYHSRWLEAIVVYDETKVVEARETTVSILLVVGRVRKLMEKAESRNDRSDD